ncbi:MAG: hypothetical protein U0Z53_19100 [Blastocatellia bacterium]
MSRLFDALILSVALCVTMSNSGFAQNDETPVAIVKKFYQQLHARKYVEGFRLSVYSPAVESLSPQEISELEPDFQRLAEHLPENVEISGEQISGDTATVFIKMPGADKTQEITLVRIDGHWRVGDRDTYRVVKKQGHDFFFNVRISVSENEAAEWLEEIFGAEIIYQKAKSKFTTLEELIQLGGVSKQLTSGAESGYRFELKLATDGQSFTVSAVPAEYGRTGRRSFFMDQTGVIRAEDRKGQPATAASSKFQLEKP